MKFTTLFAILFAIAAMAVSATPFRETNGERMARGLPPLPPQKRSGTPVYAAKRTGPSSSPGSCSTGPVQCCDSTAQADDPVAALILGLLGIIIPADVLVGITCSPISIIGAGSGSCSAQTVCCSDNSSSLISIGCIPITL
ncbi:fungal hydrophobin [Lentinula raphanica]|uniref:Hydrophobin n=1 Tax=Lentinula raphanica TaxID=153919 RepID=A0AA38P5L6_9AGAR|nr:fungal hydrophobin [Lentinula raphanica]KAJ3836767.1 fungal hydrophobin [Lentinula raphanica]